MGDVLEGDGRPVVPPDVWRAIFCGAKRGQKQGTASSQKELVRDQRAGLKPRSGGIHGSSTARFLCYHHASNASVRIEPQLTWQTGVRCIVSSLPQCDTQRLPPDCAYTKSFRRALQYCGTPTNSRGSVYSQPLPGKICTSHRNHWPLRLLPSR